MLFGRDFRGPHKIVCVYKSVCVCTSQEHRLLCQVACTMQIPACYIVAMSKLIYISFPINEVEYINK